MKRTFEINGERFKTVNGASAAIKAFERKNKIKFHLAKHTCKEVR